MKQYCLDSGVLINAWKKHYPPDVPMFKPFWDTVSKMLAAGIAFIPREAYEEIERIDDDVHRWVKERSDLVRETTEEVVLALKKIMQHEKHCKLVKLKGTRSGADPWIIAHAQVSGAVVVTEETRGSDSEPKIPEVCKALGLRCINTMQMIQEYSLV